MLKFLIEPGYDVKVPVREKGNAGIDFFVPKMTEKFSKDFLTKNPTLSFETDADGKVFIRVPPFSDVNFPSGIHSYIDANTGLIAVNKSGIATKRKCIMGACLIDPNYTGIIHMHLINTSEHFVNIYLEDKVAQFVPYTFDTEDISVVNGNNDTEAAEHFYDGLEFNNRGSKGFGEGTGNK